MTSHRAPEISIIIAAHNEAQHLPAVLCSLWAQRFTAFECIVVDDASTDATWTVLQAETDPRLVAIANTRPQGLAASLNQAAARASGPYLARVDGDEPCPPDRLERQHACLAGDDAILAVAGNYAVCAPDGRVLRITDQGARDFADGEALLAAWPAFHHGTVMMRQTAFAAAGGYDPAYAKAQDLDLWLRMLEAQPGGRLRLMPELASYRRLDVASLAGHARQVAFCRAAATNHRRRRAGLPEDRDAVARAAAVPVARFGRREAAALERCLCAKALFRARAWGEALKEVYRGWLRCPWSRRVLWYVTWGHWYLAKMWLRAARRQLT